MKKISIAIIMFLILVLVGCGSNTSPEKLWNRYISAMNAKDIEAVAASFYLENSADYNQFIEDNDPTVYFADFESLKTRSFAPEVVNENYYCANITISLSVGGDSQRKQFLVYFYRDLTTGWKFTNEVNVTAYDLALLGNAPNSYYYANIVKTADGFSYKYVYANIAGEVSDNDYVKIVAPESNQSAIVIPDQIEGKPVKIIGDFAFFDYFKILSVTIPTSKLQSITIPDSVSEIEQYAFYQAKQLQSLDLPASIRNVGKYAFASCTNMETLTINVDEAAMYDPANIVNLTGRDSMMIVGDRKLYIEDNIFLATSGAPADWSSSDAAVATVAASGKLTLIAPGQVTIRATNKNDNTLYSEATFTVLPKAQKLITSTTSVDLYRFTIKNDWFVGDTQTLSIQSTNVEWTSSNTDVATVDNTGKVTAVAPGVTTITANSTTSEVVSTAQITVALANERNVVSTYSYTPISFTGARKMYVSDLLTLATTGYDLGDILWTSSNNALATVSMYDGKVEALAKGNAIIKATLTSNPNIYTTVNIQVADVTPSITFAENSLDRLNSLKTIYIKAINPNSVVWKGTLKLPSDVKIYVPAQNYDSYLKVWADYEKMIFINENE
ncbi:MAG: Ig-like domain-containing protein [Bacilli bacterium]